MVFLSNYLVFKIVLAALGRTDYPVAGDLELKYDNANKVYLSGGSLKYIDDATLWTTIGEETRDHNILCNKINKTTTTAYEVVLPTYCGHGSFGINQDATRYVHQYPVVSGYQNGKFQVYSGTPSSGYTEYGSEIQPFNGNEVMLCSMSADGKYILVSTYNGGNDGYKMYKDTGSEYAYHSSYSSIGSYTATVYTPAFVPSNNNFVITGTDNNNTWYFKLYVYDSATDTWTGKATVSPSGPSTAHHQRGMFGKGFTYDGSYFFQSNNGVTTRGEVWSVDWNANTMTYKWHTTEGNNGDGAGGAISPDNRYVVLARHDGNPYRVYENTSGDWSTVTNVSSSFDLTGSGTSTVFGSYGVNFSGYSKDNTTPSYIGQFAGLYGDGKFRLENWSSPDVRQVYINEIGKYSVDANIAGLNYKTNEVEVTGSITPVKSWNWGTKTTLTGDNVVGGDNFGKCIHMHGDTLVAGSIREDTTAQDSGAVYVFVRPSGGTTWTQQAMLKASDAAYNDHMGDGTNGVKIYGDTVAVGVLSADAGGTNRGACYIFTRSGTTWTQQQKIVPATNDNAQFGESIALWEDTVAIGGPYYDYGGSSDSGGVQVWKRNGSGVWALEADVTTMASGISANSYFGIDCSLYEDTLVVGGHGHNSWLGAVWVFTRSGTTWTEQQKITSGLSGNNRYFGAMCKVWDNTLVVKMTGDDTGGTDSGSVWIYSRSGTTWSLNQTLRISGSSGLSTYLNFQNNLITAMDGSGTINVNVWEKIDGEWTLIKRLADENTSVSNAWGTAFAMDDNTIVIGEYDEARMHVYNKSITSELKFDGSNKLSIGNAPTSTSSKLFLGSSVYDIGALTSDLTIETPGVYKSLTYDTGSTAAYFSKTTVGAIGSTMASFELANTLYGTVQSGHTHGSSQGGFGNNTILNADGTRLLVTDPINHPSGRGRAYIYHWESGSWALKQTWDNPDGNSQRFTDGACMNEDGTRIFLQHPSSGAIYTYEYASGAWPTANAGTHVFYPGSTMAHESSTVACNKAGDVIVIGYGDNNKVKIYRRSSATSWSIDSGGDLTYNRSVAINGAGTRAFMGHSDGKIYMVEWNGSTWSSATAIITTSGYQSHWAASMMSDSAGETLVIRAEGVATDAGIYERASNGTWSRAQGVEGRTQIYGTAYPSISYDGTMVLIADYHYDSNKGRAYLWQKSGGSWSLTKTYDNPSSSPASNDYWGAGCGIARTTKDKFVIGFHGDNTAGTDYGSVWTYTNAIPDYISFDTYNKLSLSGLTNPISKIHALPTGAQSTTTYDIGTATNMYIESAGTYTAEMKDATNFALDSNVVNTVSSTILPILKFENLGTSLASNVSGVNLVNESGYTAPTYDSTNNAIQTAASSSLVCDFSSVRTSTTSDLAVVFDAYYDHNEGLTAVVTLGEYTSSPNTDFSIEQRSNMGTTIGGLSIHGTAYLIDTSIGGTYAWANTGLNAIDYKGKWTKYALVHYNKNAWWYIYVNGEWKLHITTSPIQITGTHSPDLRNFMTDGFPSKIRVFRYPGQYGTGTYSTGTKVRNIEIYDNVSFIVSPAPKLTFDGFNKYTFSGAETGSTYKLKYESNTYDLGTTSTAYINNTGTYSAEIKGATNFALSSNVVSGTVSFPSRTSYRYLALGMSRNNYENSLENMIIEFDDGTKYDNANQPASSAFTQNYAPSTGATTDVFSTSQNTNWNGNSLSWSDGTWYCPFHIDFGSGFTKKVKRVTIINRINDYQYSLIVPRLYGASSVPSTPGLAANWNYVCHVESIQKDWTSTLTSYDMEPKAYRYIGLAGYRTVYAMHIYEFSIELMDGTVYDSSNKPTVSSDLSVAGGSVANTIDGDWTNYANWNNASTHTSASQQYVYLKVDLGSAKKVKHIRVWNQYACTYTNGTNSMNYYGSSTNTSSTDAEGSSDWNRLGPIEMLKSDDATEKTINSSLYDSKLEFDGYNKLSLNKFDPTSTKLTSGENTYDIGTATNIYITENGTYDAEVTSASAFALTSNVVTGSVTQSTDYKLLHDPNTESSFPSYAITNGTNRSTNAGKEKYLFYPLETSSGTTTTDAFENTTSSTYGEITLTYPQNIIVSNVVVQHPSRSNVPNALPQTAELFTSIDDSNYTSHGTVSMTNDFPDLYVITVSNPVTSRYVRVKIDNGNTEGLGRIHVHGLESVSPSLTHDGYKLVVSGITPTSSTLKYLSNTYDIGSATNVYIKDVGTYTAESKNSTDFAFTSNVSSGTIKTIEPVITGGNGSGHALTYDRKLYGWGKNTQGHLGVGDASNKTVPTLCTGIPQGEVASIWNQAKRGQSRWAKTEDGRIWVAGDHGEYCLPGSSSDFLTFTDVSVEFGDHTQPATSVVWASGAERATQVLMENGDVWSFGDDSGSPGVLGQGASPTNDRTPRKLSGISNVTKIANNGDLVMALDSSNVVWMWGRTEIGSTSPGWGPYNVPTNIMGTGTANLTSLLVSGETVTDIECGTYTMFVITSKGTVYATGYNGHGQFGLGPGVSGKTSSDGWGKIEYFTTNVITVNKLYTNEGEPGVFADTSDGWYCWGDNTSGKLGLGDTSVKYSPVKFTGVSNIKKFGSGDNASYAITEDGKYYAWGNGSEYRRGDNATGDISYPKYIDTLPNILAPLFEFDGYDKVFVGGTFVYEFYVSVKAAGASGLHYVNINQLSSSTMILKSNMATVHVPIYSGSVANMFDGSNSTVLSINDPNHEVDTKLWTLVTDKELADLTFVVDRPVYMPGWRITCNGKIVLNDTTNSTSTTPSPATFTKSLSSSGSMKFTKGTTTYDAGKASIITVPDTGTYDAQLKKSGVFTLKSATVPATSSTGLYTWAFHHGNFDNAYGDGDILTARDNGRFYADTPAYTGDIGTISAVKGQENPRFTANDTLDGDYNTKYGWSTNSGWAVDASSVDSVSWGGQKWTAFNKDTTGDYTDAWYSAAAPSVSSPQWLEIKYPSAVKIKWYTIRSRNNSTQVYFPKEFKLQGSVSDGTTWVDIGTDQFFNANEWPYGETKTFHVFDNDTAYQYYRLYIWAASQTSRVSVQEWRLYNESSSGTFLSEATKETTGYTFAPPSGGLTANVMMVAGGAGGGTRAEGGGGGAGGLVYTAGTSLANGATKTIVVGNGDSGGSGNGEIGFSGKNTTFTGLDNAVGGGGGGFQNTNPNSGGSGGGGNGGDGSNHNFTTGASGTSGQGNAGGDGANTLEGGGGGGAGGVGANASSGNAGDGGIGKFFGTGSSFTDFGGEYGDGGWFAGGGGGGNRNESEIIPGGRGGGGYGQSYYGYMGMGGSQHGMVHTGGGGGGGGPINRDQHPGYDTTGNGGVKGAAGRGGSGIVLIQTNVAPPNGANTAVVQVGNPRRRSLPPAVDYMGSEVNRWYIIDGASMPTYKLPTHWYADPNSANSNHVFSTEGSHSLQKRADGGTSNVWYATSGVYFADYGTKMAQTADAIFMPVEQQRYDVLLSIGSNGQHDIQLEMAADGTAKLYRNNGTTLLQAGTITCFTVGKWHHIALTVDSEHNAVGYVNGHPVISTTYTSNYDVGSRGGNMHMRVGVNATFRKFLVYEVSTYNFHMSPKQVLQRAAEVGLGPKLEYDGLNTLKILNTEPGSTVRLFTSNVADTSNVYIVADPAAGEYKVPESGKYYAEIKGTDTFTITKTIDVDDPLYAYPPVATGTKSSLTVSTSADTWNTWTMSGTANGDGQYQVKTSHATNAPGGTNATAAGLFTNLVKIETITEGGTTHYGFLHTNQLTNFDITLQLPSAKTIRKYVLYPADTNAPVSTPGGSADPLLPGNGSEENTRRPKSWALKGSNNGSDWTTIHTVTNKPPSIYGDVHTVSSPASYQYYMLSISANNGSSSNIQLGEWQLWGDA